MSRIRLYADEDAMRNAVIAALRVRKVDVLTPSDCGMVNRDDDEHLDYASREERVLYPKSGSWRWLAARFRGVDHRFLWSARLRSSRKCSPRKSSRSY